MARIFTGVYKHFTMSGLIFQKGKINKQSMVKFIEKPCTILGSLLLPGERLFPTKIQSILQSVKESVLAPPCSCKFRFRCFFSSNPLLGLEEQKRTEGGLSQSFSPKDLELIVLFQVVQYADPDINSHNKNSSKNMRQTIIASICPRPFPNIPRLGCTFST